MLERGSKIYCNLMTVDLVMLCMPHKATVRATDSSVVAVWLRLKCCG